MKQTILKSLRKVHGIVQPDKGNFGRNWRIFPAKEYASGLIANAINAQTPQMVARLGAVELSCMTNYLGVRGGSEWRSSRRFISRRTPSWWWNESTIAQMGRNAGFFPTDTSSIERFCELMLVDLSYVDILGSWLKEESFFSAQLSHAKRVMLEDLEPFFTAAPWTHALRGKRVLVVHPFAETILRQYRSRMAIFPDGLLPDFELNVLKAVQSIAGEKSDYANWFDALESMKQKIDAQAFDVCIIGCGAYGFPLAAHVKRSGKKAIHLGGVTQLLFGIKGRRWEQFVLYPYENLFNEAWVRPGASDVPQDATTVEGGCYW